MSKLDKLKNLMELLQNDTITPKELEGFLKMVLEVVGKSKKELESLSKENVDYMNDVISYISKEHKNIIETVSQETGKKSQEIDSKMKEAKTLLKEIKSIKATPGKDGNDADEDSVVEKLLGKIKPPEETAEQIFDKINSLGEDFKFDSSKIVLPEDVMIKIDRINKKIKHGLGGSTARNLYQLGDVEVAGVTNGQVLKYNTAKAVWEAGTDVGGVAWGGITGTLADQTDLTAYVTGLPVSTFTNDAGYLTSYTETSTLADISSQSNTLAKSTYEIGGSGAYPLFKKGAAEILGFDDTFWQQTHTLDAATPTSYQKVVSNNLFGFGIKGVSDLIQNGDYTDVFTGSLNGDFTGFGLEKATYWIGALDFSDDNDQGSATTRYTLPDDGASAVIQDMVVSSSGEGLQTIMSNDIWAVATLTSVPLIQTSRTNNNVNIGVSGSTLGKLDIRTTTGQALVLSYDASNYAPFKVNSSGELLILPTGKKVIIGEDVGSQNNTLNVMGSTGSTLLRIQDTDTNGTVGLIFQNDSQRWDFKVAGNASDKFTIRDATGGIDKFNIDIGATGDISFVNFGSLGVGTTSPLDKLTVLSSTPGDGIALKLPNDTNYALRVRAYNGGGILQLYGASGNVQTSIGGANDADAYFNSGGSLIVGGDTPNASAKLQADSTTQGFLPPRMTTTQRDAISSPAAGLVIYNTTTNVLNFHNGSAWGAV